MMDRSAFRGTGVAIVTPFKNGNVDFQAFGRVVDHCADGGVDYIVCLGTTGESVTLSDDEQREVLDFAIAHLGGRLPLVAGNFGGNNTRALVSQIENYDFTGIDAILSSSPAYNKPTQAGILEHYSRIADASPVPVIVYNVPGRTASNMTAATTINLAEASSSVIAVKEASGDMIQGSQIADKRPKDFLLISGDDPTALSLIACGGDGVISVIANAFPRAFSTMIRAAMEGDFATARKIHLALIDVHPLLYVEGNPVGIKAALSILGLCEDELRLPLLTMSAGNKKKLEEEIKALDVLLK